MNADELQSLPGRVAAGLQKLALLMRHEAWHAADRRGLSPTQAQALATLAASSEPLGVGAVADRLTLTPGTVSEAVRVLVEKGLVRKERSAEDARAVLLRLTPAGRREADRAGVSPQVLLEATTALDDASQDALLRGLTALIRSLQEAGRVPVSRMCGTCRYFRPHEHDDARRPHHCAWLDEPIGDADLRFECPEQVDAGPESAQAVWDAFTSGRPLETELARRLDPTEDDGAA